MHGRLRRFPSSSGHSRKNESRRLICNMYPYNNGPPVKTIQVMADYARIFCEDFLFGVKIGSRYIPDGILINYTTQICYFLRCNLLMTLLVQAVCRLVVCSYLITNSSC